MTTYCTTFGEWLEDRNLANYVDGNGDLLDCTTSGITQNFFSVQYTAWLNEIAKSAEVRDYLTQNGYIDGDDIITVELNQNSADGVPYIKINGVASDALDSFFSEREDVLLKTGKVAQLRYYSDVFTLGAANSAPVLADTADPAAVAEPDGATAGSAAHLTGSFAVSDADVGDTLTAAIVGDPVVKLNGGDPKNGYPAALTAAGAFTLAPLAQTSTGGAGTAIAWTYDPGAADLDFLRKGDTLTITYQVKVNDGTADSAVQDVTITFTGENDAVNLEDTASPEAVAELADASAQDIEPITGSFAVSDKDIGDDLTASIVGKPVVLLDGETLETYPAALTDGAFSLTNASQKSAGGAGTAIGWTYDPGAANLDFLRAGQKLTVTYQVQVSDGTANSALQDVTITFTGTNDAVVLGATTSPAPVAELADASAQDIDPITGSFAVSDKDVGDTLTASIVGDPVVRLGTTILTSGYPAALTAEDAFSLSNASQKSTGGGATIDWTYDPGAADLDFLRAGQKLTLTYQVQVNDETTDSAIQDVTITFTGTNDAVVLEATSTPAAVAELADASAQDIAPIAGSFAVSDLDIGDTLTATVLGTPVVKLGGTTITSGYPATLTADSAFSLTNAEQTSTGAGTAIGWKYDPGAANLDFLRDGQSLTITYQVKVSDGHTDSTQDVTITIAGTNDSPTDIIFTAQAPSSGTTLPTTVALLSAIDPDAGASISFSVSSQLALQDGDGRTFSIDKNQLQITNGTGIDDFVDRYAVTVKASDEHGASREETINIIFGTNANGADNLNFATGDDIIYALSSGNSNATDIVVAGSGNDQVYGQDGKDQLDGGDGADILTGGAGADIMTGGSGADMFVIGNTDSSITLSDADRITDFVSGTDKLKLGLAGTVGDSAATYVEAGSAVANFNAAKAAANAQLATLSAASSANELYAFQFDDTNGYLFNDIDGNGTADQVIVLVGVNSAEIAATDIIA